MARNIVLCLDGTGNQLKAKGNTNVVLLYQMLNLSEPDRQVAFYDPGVGTFAARGAWTSFSQKLTTLFGLAFGFGIKDNIADAYTYLMEQYRPGDRVFVFGFSRGAFTARALSGMSYRAGLMRPGAENLVPYLVSSYTKGDEWSGDDWKKIDQFARTFSFHHDGSLALPIHFLGLWDSVKALGWLRWDPKWPYTRQLPNARVIRHAVSIDEKRRPYAEYLVRPNERSDLSEVWFAGVHSDVGGTFIDDDKLSTITLKWMTDQALQAGLLLRKGAYERTCAVEPDDALGKAHRMGWIWAILTLRRRPIPRSASVHYSVKDRLVSDIGYRLPTAVPDDAWRDEEWTQPSALAP
ncbi:MAG: DUF2235 domain-containing protein [Acidimicrobiia bacterium]